MVIELYATERVVSGLVDGLKGGWRKGEGGGEDDGGVEGCKVVLTCA